MNYPPSILLKTALQQLNLAGDGTAWPIAIGYLPDNEIAPQALLVIYDTDPMLDGVLQREAVTVEHPGLQLLCRTADYMLGWSFMTELKVELQKLRNYVVTPNSEDVTDTHTIASISLFTGVLALGLEPGTKNRYLFTLNLLSTFIRP